MVFAATGTRETAPYLSPHRTSPGHSPRTLAPKSSIKHRDSQKEPITVMFLLEQLPRSLREAIESRKAVPVVGPGVALRMRSPINQQIFPTWREFFQQAVARLRQERRHDRALLIEAMFSDQPTDWTTMAKATHDSLIGCEWLEFLDSQFYPGRIELNAVSAGLIRWIWSIAADVVLTTNYDDTLYSHCPQKAVYALLDRRPPNTRGRGVVWHLHGFIHTMETTTNVVFKPRDSCSKKALRRLKDDLAGKVLFFIGFDDGCIDVVDIIDWLTRNVAPIPCYVHSDSEYTSRRLHDYRYRQIVHVMTGLQANDANFRGHREPTGSFRRSPPDVVEGLELDYGRYRLSSQISNTSMSELWEAVDTITDQDVWIRLLNPAHRESERHVQRFFRGARLTSSIKHPAIVRVLDAYKCDNGVYYYVLERVNGRRLVDVINDKPLGSQEIFNLLIQTADLLMKTHENRFIYRDISPYSIFIASDNSPRFIDFDLLTEDDRFSMVTMTMSEKFAYLAPEVHGKRSGFDASTDLWALAMTILFCFKGELVRDLWEPRNRKKIPAIIDSVQCSRSIKFALKRALEVNKERRVRSAAEFLGIITGYGEVSSRSPISITSALTSVVGFLLGIVFAKRADFSWTQENHVILDPVNDGGLAIVDGGSTPDAEMQEVGAVPPQKLGTAVALVCPDGASLITDGDSVFCIDRSLVVGQEYQKCINEHNLRPSMGCSNAPVCLQDELVLGGVKKCFDLKCKFMDQLSVNCVSVYRAIEFCGWRGGRLPSASERLIAERQNKSIFIAQGGFELVASKENFCLLRTDGAGTEVERIDINNQYQIDDRAYLRCAYDPRDSSKNQP